MSYKINNVECSFEEYLVNLYLEELRESGFIDKIIYQPKPFVLSEEVPKKFYREKINKQGEVKLVYSKKQNLINRHIYTSDFKVIWNEKSEGIFEADIDTKIGINLDIPFISNSCEDINSYIEVKGSFNMQNMVRMFTSHIQPRVYLEYREYVQLIKPLELFRATFVPNKALEYMYYKKDTKNGLKGAKKYNWEYRLLETYLKNKNK
jgi:hypothetical protein